MDTAPKAIVNLGELPLEFSSEGTRFWPTFSAGGRLEPMGHCEGEDVGEAE